MKARRSSIASRQQRKPRTRISKSSGDRISHVAAPAIAVEIANQQSCVSVDEQRLQKAVACVLSGEGLQQASISLAIVDDRVIQSLNRQFLKHDYPTDVLSFALEKQPDFLEGEIIVSAETAVAAATGFAWTPDDELLLYVIHGALHLVGYDDQSAAAKRKMNERERFYLHQLGVALQSEVRGA